MEYNSALELQQVRNVGPINTGKRFTHGLDFLAAQEFKTDTCGIYTLSTRFSKVLDFTQEDFPGSGSVRYYNRFYATGAALDEFSVPEWRGNVTLDWTLNRYSAAIGWNFTSSYKEDASGQNFVGSEDSPTDIRDVGDYHTFDVRLGYRIPKIEADVQFGINNVFDERPRRVLSTFGDGYDRIIGDLRGRYWFAQLTKQF